MTEEHNDFRKSCHHVMDAWLTVEYPTIFSYENPIPLATDVSKELLAQLPSVISLMDFKNTMQWYYRRTTYLEAIVKHDQRINLQGEQVSEVAELDKVAARKRLDEKHKQKIRYQTKTAEPTPVEITEPMQPIEEIKSTKLVLKRKTVESTTEAIIEPIAEVTPVKAESKPTPVAAPSSNVAVAKGLKVTLVVEPASIPTIDSTGKKTVTLTIQVANTDIKVTTSLSSKSYRKAMNSIEELGTDGCNAIIQGSMKKYGVIEDAGLVIQPKKAAASEPTAFS
jgi:sRNA-binding protein